MLIDTSFPGGNVQINAIQNGHIHFGPDKRDNFADWFYWCFRVRGGAGRTWHFYPCRENLLTSHAPAVSVDGGVQWSWADPGCVQEDGSFILTIPHEADDWRVSMQIPYTQEHLALFTKRHAGRWVIDPLCLTSRGNHVPVWRIGPAAEQAKHRVFITARHHCCESMASYVLEGLVEAAVADDELGRWWQEHVSLTTVPFVDWDGVVLGDQGKNRGPHDHNRDYTEQSIYPQTPCIEQEVLGLAAYELDVVLDLHCPWIHGKHNEEIYMVGQESPRLWAQQQRLASHLEQAVTGPLSYDPADNVAFGEAWNQKANFADGRSFSKWASLQPGVALCTTMEIPYALARGQVMTADNVRTFGSQLALALRNHLSA